MQVAADPDSHAASQFFKALVCYHVFYLYEVGAFMWYGTFEKQGSDFFIGSKQKQAF